jgi:LacI family transcriptional regulator
LKRVRLSDVARIAGVSSSTVDRVLNARPGVKPDTVARVEAAMQRLGYSVNSLNRRLQDSPPSVAVFLPVGGTPAVEAVCAALEDAARHRAEAGVHIHRVEIASRDPDALVRACDAIGEGIDAVITCVVETPAVTLAVNRLTHRGVQVVTVAGDAPDSLRHAFFGCDGFSAGRTAGALMARFLAPGADRASVLVGDPADRCHLDRRSGFEQAMAMQRPEVIVSTEGACRNSDDAAQRLVERVLARRGPQDGLYIIGDGHAGAVAALKEAGSPVLPVIAHELTDDTRAALEAGLYAALVAQDPVALARFAFDAAIHGTVEDVRFRPAGIFLRENLPPA